MQRALRQQATFTPAASQLNSRDPTSINVLGILSADFNSNLFFLKKDFMKL